jgi:hypothetical protein
VGLHSASQRFSALSCILLPQKRCFFGWSPAVLVPDLAEKGPRWRPGRRRASKAEPAMNRIKYWLILWDQKVGILVPLSAAAYRFPIYRKEDALSKFH